MEHQKICQKNKQKKIEIELINFELEEKQLLGEGSFGKVYKGQKYGQEYAIKKIFLNQIFKKAVYEKCMLDYVKREILIHQQLEHPNIIKLYNYYEDEEFIYLTLQYAEKGNLKLSGKITEIECFKIIYKVFLAVQYLHEKNIIHRDLKPENLLIDVNDEIKICDFGLSFQNVHKTKLNMLCGTIDYLAPEVIKNEIQNEALDIWSLGGQRLLKGKTKSEKIQEILNLEEIVFVEDIENDLQAMIKRMLDVDYKKRISINEILQHDWVKKMEDLLQIKDIKLVDSTQESVNQSFEREFIQRLIIKEKEEKKDNEQGIIPRVLNFFGCVKRDKN